LDHDYGGAPEGWVIDLSDVSNPVVHEFSNDLGWDSPSEIREIDFRGDIAIATIARWTTEGRRLFLEEADFSNPEEPRLRASRILDTYVFSIAACPNKTVVGLGTGIAVHNPGATLYLVGRSPDYGSANRFGTGDTSGALANGDIVTFDLNDPGNPTELARLDLDEYYNNLRVTGTTMIAVASGHDTLTTIDFSEPESPVPLDSIVVENLQFDLEVEDDTAYVLGCSFVANESCEISLIDLTDPRNLVIRSNLEIPSPEYGKVSGFRIREGVLFIQTRSSTLPSSFLSVDVTNPAEPTILDEINAGAYEFDLVGDVALLGTSFGIEIVNISNPSELILEHLNSDIRTGLIESVGNGLVSLINSKGCWLSDFTDPDYPITYDTPEISRSWEHGIIIDNVWLRPSQHVIDVVSLECRPPEAEIRASGRGPTIWFEDLSRYQVTERLWDFGDGETSGQLNPVHTYASPGNYTVTLTVSSPNGTDTVIEEIEVGPPRVRGGSRRR